MPAVDVHEATIGDLGRAMEAGETSAEEIILACLERIEAFDQAGPALNAIAFVSPTAREDARRLDVERTERGARGPLHGIPILVKDNHDVAGWPTRAGCRGLEGLVADRDAEIIARLRLAGAVLLAKTNLHELAAGITTVASAHGRTRNPYDPTRNPGGSSGGSSAAVAASFAPVGLGSDTCGSIRIPAAQCSLYGLRVTQGRTPMDGVVPLSLTQDVLGPIARTVEDLAVVLDVVVDSPEAATFTRALDSEALAGRRIGRLTTLFSEAEEAREVCQRVDAALAEMAKLGAEIVDVEISELPERLDENFLVILGDVPGDLADYLSRHPSAPFASLEALHASGTIHPEVAPIIAGALSGPIKESPDYARAIENRAHLRRLLVSAMDELDLAALAYPPILQTAVLLGEDQPGSNAHASANSGLPAISMPAGMSSDGLPVGLELLGRPDADAALVSMAYAWQHASAKRVPPASTPALGGLAARARNES